MAFRQEIYPRFCFQDTLLVGDATRTLIAAVTGQVIVVTYAKVTGIVAAAQAVYVGDTSGTVRALNLAASFPVAAEAVTQLQVGLPLTVSEALIIKPAAAGPSMHCVVEGFFARVGAF